MTTGELRSTTEEARPVRRLRLLWCRPDNIGDHVLASAELPYLRQKFQQAEITVLCPEGAKSLYAACPHIDQVLPFDRALAWPRRIHRYEWLQPLLLWLAGKLRQPGWGSRVLRRCLLLVNWIFEKRLGPFSNPSADFLAAVEGARYRAELAGRLQEQGFDLALNSVYARDPLSDFLTLRSGARECIGMLGDPLSQHVSEKARWDRHYSRLLPSEGEGKRELDRNIDFLKGLGIAVAGYHPAVWTSAADERFAEKFFSDNDLSRERTIALFPGASAPIRLYPHYATVLETLREFNLLILGGREMATLAMSLCQGFTGNALNLAGKTTLPQLAAILKRCSLYVGADSAGGHVACAVGIPQVVILGGGHFGRFLPYDPLTSVACLPLECFGCGWQCRYREPYCIRFVAPTVIKKAIQETLNNRASKPRLFIQAQEDWRPVKEQPAWAWPNRFLDAPSVELIQVKVS